MDNVLKLCLVASSKCSWKEEIVVNTTINGDPSGTTLPVVGGTGRNGVTDLAHEMFHGQQANQGMLDSRLYNGIEREEWGAVDQENLVRSQMGIPLRTHYIKNVDASTGSVTGGTGVRMITPKANQEIDNTYRIQ